MKVNKETEIPSQVLNFDKIKSQETKVIDPNNLPANLVDRLPQPTGWRILVLPYQGTGKTKGGVLLADETVEMHQVATVCGYILRVYFQYFSWQLLLLQEEEGNQVLQILNV